MSKVYGQQLNCVRHLAKFVFRENLMIHYNNDSSLKQVLIVPRDGLLRAEAHVLSRQGRQFPAIGFLTLLFSLLNSLLLVVQTVMVNNNNNNNNNNTNNKASLYSHGNWLERMECLLCYLQRRCDEWNPGQVQRRGCELFQRDGHWCRDLQRLRLGLHQVLRIPPLS